MVRETPRPSEKRELEAKLRKVTGSIKPDNSNLEKNVTSSLQSSERYCCEPSSRSSEPIVTEQPSSTDFKPNQSEVEQTITTSVTLDNKVEADKVIKTTRKSGLKPPQKSYKIKPQVIKKSGLRKPSGIRPPTTVVKQGTDDQVQTNKITTPNRPATLTSNIPRPSLKKYHFNISLASQPIFF